MPKFAPNAIAARSTTPCLTASSPKRVFGQFRKRENGTRKGRGNGFPMGRGLIPSRRAGPGVLHSRMVAVPGFLDMQPERDLGQVWGGQGVPPASTDMQFSLALMIAVDRTNRKWMDDHKLSEADREALWGKRTNCPNPEIQKITHYRAGPLNGVWATAHYLHNGSVPSLYWMLRPA